MPGVAPGPEGDLNKQKLLSLLHHTKVLRLQLGDPVPSTEAPGVTKRNCRAVVRAQGSGARKLKMKCSSRAAVFILFLSQNSHLQKGDNRMTGLTGV